MPFDIARLFGVEVTKTIDADSIDESQESPALLAREAAVVVMEGLDDVPLLLHETPQGFAVSGERAAILIGQDGSVTTAKSEDLEEARVLPTKNRPYGLWGTIKMEMEQGHEEPIADDLTKYVWDKTFEAVMKGAIKVPGATVDWKDAKFVRAFLDGKEGRYLADAILDAAMAKVGRPSSNTDAAKAEKITEIDDGVLKSAIATALKNPKKFTSRRSLQAWVKAYKAGELDEAIDDGETTLEEAERAEALREPELKALLKKAKVDTVRQATINGVRVLITNTMINPAKTLKRAGWYNTYGNVWAGEDSDYTVVTRGGKFIIIDTDPSDIDEAWVASLEDDNSLEESTETTVLNVDGLTDFIAETAAKNGWRLPADLSEKFDLARRLEDEDALLEVAADIAAAGSFEEDFNAYMGAEGYLTEKCKKHDEPKRPGRASKGKKGVGSPIGGGSVVGRGAAESDDDAADLDERAVDPKGALRSAKATKLEGKRIRIALSNATDGADYRDMLVSQFGEERGKELAKAVPWKKHAHYKLDEDAGDVALYVNANDVLKRVGKGKQQFIDNDIVRELEEIVDSVIYGPVGKKASELINREVAKRIKRDKRIMAHLKAKGFALTEDEALDEATSRSVLVGLGETAAGLNNYAAAATAAAKKYPQHAQVLRKAAASFRAAAKNITKHINPLQTGGVNADPASYMGRELDEGLDEGSVRTLRRANANRVAVMHAQTGGVDNEDKNVSVMFEKPGQGTVQKVQALAKKAGGKDIEVVKNGGDVEIDATFTSWDKADDYAEDLAKLAKKIDPDNAVVTISESKTTNESEEDDMTPEQKKALQEALSIIDDDPAKAKGLLEGMLDEAAPFDATAFRQYAEGEKFLKAWIQGEGDDALQAIFREEIVGDADAMRRYTEVYQQSRSGNNAVDEAELEAFNLDEMEYDDDEAEMVLAGLYGLKNQKKGNLGNFWKAAKGNKEYALALIKKGLVNKDFSVNKKGIAALKATKIPALKGTVKEDEGAVDAWIDEHDFDDDGMEIIDCLYAECEENEDFDPETATDEEVGQIVEKRATEAEKAKRRKADARRARGQYKVGPGQRRAMSKGAKKFAKSAAGRSAMKKGVKKRRLSASVEFPKPALSQFLDEARKLGLPADLDVQVSGDTFTVTGLDEEQAEALRGVMAG